VIKMLGLSMREIDRIAYRKPFLPTQENMTEREKACMGFDYAKTVSIIHKGFSPNFTNSQRLARLVRLLQLLLSNLYQKGH